MIGFDDLSQLFTSLGITVHAEEVIMMVKVNDKRNAGAITYEGQYKLKSH